MAQGNRKRQKAMRWSEVKLRPENYIIKKRDVLQEAQKPVRNF